jgi:two-component system, LytTR family, sensor kinase
LIKVNDKWLRILLILLPVLLAAFTSGALELPLKQVKLIQFSISVASIVIICEGVRWLMYKGRQMRHNKKPLVTINVVVIAGGLIFTSIVLAASGILKQYLAKSHWDMSAMTTNLYVNNRRISFDLASYSVGNAVINFFFLYTCYKVLFHFALLKQTERMKEILEKEKLRAELQQLKGIVNPHFLFNNLNSLSALISEDPAKAEFFLDELTKVFRYLLRNNNNDLTELGAELQFIHSYYQLLQIRYGKGIEMTIDADQRYNHLQLPPLTLQLLLENAVKHNHLHKEHPLRIQLYPTAGNKLVMKNNIIPKNTLVESTGIGLKSINARYSMLEKNGISIEQNDKEFSVIIPLIG